MCRPKEENDQARAQVYRNQLHSAVYSGKELAGPCRTEMQGRRLWTKTKMDLADPKRQNSRTPTANSKQPGDGDIRSQTPLAATDGQLKTTQGNAGITAKPQVGVHRRPTLKPPGRPEVGQAPAGRGRACESKSTKAALWRRPPGPTLAAAIRGCRKMPRPLPRRRTACLSEEVAPKCQCLRSSNTNHG